MDFIAIREQSMETRKLCQQLRVMIVERLDLGIDPEWISDDQPLFGRGLELDSVDTLELILGVESDFGVSLTEDEPEVFGCVARLAERVRQEREQSQV